MKTITLGNKPTCKKSGQKNDPKTNCKDTVETEEKSLLSYDNANEGFDTSMENTHIAKAYAKAMSIRRHFLHEDLEKRTLNGKHYIGNNDTVTAIYKERPVHFMDADGLLQDIDNTLVETVDGFETKSGAFKTNFIKKSVDGKVFELGRNNCKVSLFSHDIAKRGSVLERQEKLSHEANSSELSNNLVVFRDVTLSTDIEYVVESDGIKENILIKAKSDSYEYGFDLAIDNLTIGASNDGKTLELKSKTTGQVEFLIPAPFMFDANGEYSDAVYYEISPKNENLLNIKIVADTTWIDAQERAFPVVVDPMILIHHSDVFISRVQRWNRVLCGCGTAVWNNTNHQGIRVGRSGGYEYRTLINVNRSLIPISNMQTIQLATMNLHVNLGMVNSSAIAVRVNGINVNYEFLQTGALVYGITFGITNAIRQKSTDSVVVEVRASQEGLMFLDSPSLEIVAIPNIEIEVARERIGLAGGVNGDLKLGSGNLVASFTSVSTGASTLPLNISHVNRLSDENFFCGQDWRLSLHQNLRRNFSSDSIADWFYTDGSGTVHGFREIFYFLDAAGKKQTVARNTVAVGVDGKLTHTIGSGTNVQTYEVFRDFITATGLRLTTRLENMWNGVQRLDFFDQRRKEERQLEETIRNQEEILNNLVIVEPNGNVRKTFSADKANALWSSWNNFWSYYNNVANNVVVMDRHTAMQLRAMQADTSNNEHRNELSSSVRSRNTRNRMEELFRDYLVTLEKRENLRRQLPISFIQDADMRLGFNFFGDLCVVMDSNDNIATIEYDDIQTSSGQRKVITGVSCDQQKTVFRYNRAGLLISITNPLGHRATYKYRPNTNILERVNYPCGEKVSFDYVSSGVTVGQISRVEASDKTRSDLSYNGFRLSNVQNRTMANGFKDTGALLSSVPANGHEVYNVAVNYSPVGTTTITADQIENRYYLGLHEDLIGKESFYISGSIREVKARRSFSHLSRNNSWGYSVKEVGNALHIRASVLSGSANIAFHTIQRTALLGEFEGLTEFMLSAFATATGALATTNMNFSTAFRSSSANLPNPRYGIRAEVRYTGTNAVTDTFRASLDYRNSARQLIALPVTLRRDRLNNLQDIRLFIEFAGHPAGITATFSDIRFAPAQWEYAELNCFQNPTRHESSETLLSQGVYKKSATVNSEDIVYDENDRLIYKCVSHSTFKGSLAPIVNKAISKNEYSTRGSLARTECYTEGEEGTSGKVIMETVFDSEGRAISKIAYNTLDSTSKIYSKNSLSDEEEQALASHGNQFGYGFDRHGRITSINQSTEDGEANKNTIRYVHGHVTRLSAGRNTVNYEYDAQGRKTLVQLNGFERMRYSYGRNLSVASQMLAGVNFAEFRGNSVSASMVGTGGSVVETRTDLLGRLRRVAVNSETVLAHNYNADNTLSASGDGLTNSRTNYTYNPVTKQLVSVDRTQGSGAVGANVVALSENYEYNSFGQIDKRMVSGAVNQTYVYTYKDDASRHLESIALPYDNLVYKPKSDVNGRDTGKELFSGNSTNPSFGEYIYYRNHGDRATNMPSSIRYGKLVSNNYAIGDGLSYKYDVLGNITQIRNNGELVLRYTYDKIGRLVREDNKQLRKTMLWSYDNNGNILFKHEAKYTLKENSDEIESTIVANYSYDFVHGDRLVGFNNQAIVYDGTQNAFGGLVEYLGNNITWTNGNLTRYGSINFSYDGYGRRITKNNTVYTYDLGGQLIRQSQGQADNTLEFIRDGSGLCAVRQNEITYVYRKNIQGDITHIFLLDGTLQACYNYDAWGNHEVVCYDKSGRKLVDEHGNSTAPTSHIGNLNPYRYRGYMYDTETGLYFLKTRFYDPKVGRFISQDNVSYLDPKTINGLNLYAYCGNNPVMNIDPDGTFFRAIGRAISTVVAAVVAPVVAVVAPIVAAVAPIIPVVAAVAPITTTLAVAAAATGVAAAATGIAAVATVLVAAGAVVATAPIWAPIVSCILAEPEDSTYIGETFGSFEEAASYWASVYGPRMANYVWQNNEEWTDDRGPEYGAFVFSRYVDGQRRYYIRRTYGGSWNVVGGFIAGYVTGTLRSIFSQSSMEGFIHTHPQNVELSSSEADDFLLTLPGVGRGKIFTYCSENGFKGVWHYPDYGFFRSLWNMLIRIPDYFN